MHTTVFPSQLPAIPQIMKAKRLNGIKILICLTPNDWVVWQDFEFFKYSELVLKYFVLNKIHNAFCSERFFS